MQTSLEQRRPRLSRHPTVTTGAPARTRVRTAPAMHSVGGRTRSTNAMAAAVGDRRVHSQCNIPGATRRCSRPSVTRPVMALSVIEPTVRIRTSCRLQRLLAGASSPTSSGLRIALMLPNRSSLVSATYASQALLAAQRRRRSFVPRALPQGLTRHINGCPRCSIGPRWPQPWPPSASQQCRALRTNPRSSNA